MKAKYIIIVLLVATAAYLLYRYGKKKKSIFSAPDKLPPLSTATPPIDNSQGIVSTTSGNGAEAIARRIAEINGSSEGKAMENQVRAGMNILNGVSDRAAAYYNSSLSRGAISSANAVPLNLTSSQYGAIQAFAAITPSQNAWDTAGNLLAANINLKKETGTAFVTDAAMKGDNYFVSNVICNTAITGKQCTVAQIGSRGGGTGTQIRLAAEITVNDQKTIAENWLKYADIYAANVKTRAINDLRSAGWKFTGFDF